VSTRDVIEPFVNPDEPTIRDAVLEYLRVAGLNHTTNTVNNIRSQIVRFGLYLDPFDPIGGVTSRDVENYFIDEVQVRNKSAGSYNKVIGSLRGFLTFCASRGWVKTDLLANIKKRPPQGKRPRLYLNAHELVALLGHAENPRDRCMLAVAMNSAFRASELVGLTIADVDLANGFLRVYVMKSKTWDLFPITSELDTELRLWMTIYSAALQADGIELDGSMMLFPARAWQRYLPGDDGILVRTDGPWQPHKAVYKAVTVVHRTLKLAGYDELAFEGWHTIRRSLGRLLFDDANANGRDRALVEVASALHHKSVATTEIYLNMEVEREARDRRLAANHSCPA
jgi:site-specific recombinase XerD